MTEPAALRPLQEADDAIRRLHEYESTSDLTAAVATVVTAIERSLRLRLRADPEAPERDRLTALSPEEMPLESVVKSLRTRDLISLELAGTLHELERAGTRAAAGEVRPGDADLAIRAVELARRELRSPAPADATPPPAEAEPEAVPPERRGRWMAWLAAGFAAVFLIMLAVVLVRGGESDYQRAVSMFRAGRLDSASVVFRQVLDDRPRHVSSMLYLGRIHRRQGELTEAASVLRSAVAEAPGDADVRRELGHLFMDLGQPRSAVAQFERAVEHDPEEMRNWVGLIRALRAADDPRAERLLREAPADVQALLGPAG